MSVLLDGDYGGAGCHRLKGNQSASPQELLTQREGMRQPLGAGLHTGHNAVDADGMAAYHMR